MKSLIEIKLKVLAKLIIAKYKPVIIGVTGSVGKTSTKDAIYTVLASKYNVRTNIKNYNNEIGVPLTIIGCESPGRNILGWIGVFFKAGCLLLIKNKKYPEKLVLEMGIDHPGDMDYHNSIVKCDIGVVTMIGTVHMEYFKNRRHLIKEKGKLVTNLKKDGWAILNYDNKEALSIKDDCKTKVLTFGQNPKANVFADEVKFSFEEDSEEKDLQGISFKIRHNGAVVPVLLQNVLGYNTIYAALAAASVGVAFDMNLVEIAKALKNLRSPKGRMNLIEGIKYTTIIDDTYNAEPESVISAIDVLKKIPIKENARRFAILGDMLELGKESELKHLEIGKYIVKSRIDRLIVVGERARDIARGAIDAGMNETHIFHFDNSELSKKFVQDRIKQGDLILIKGSQGMRMEKIVKEIMAEPLIAEELLVRQGKSWQ